MTRVPKHMAKEKNIWVMALYQTWKGNGNNIGKTGHHIHIYIHVGVSLCVLTYLWI